MHTTALQFEHLAVAHYGLLERFYRQQRSQMRIKNASQVWIARDPQLCAGLCLHQLPQGLWLTGLLVAAQKRQQGIGQQLLSQSLSPQTEPTWLFCQPELERFYRAHNFYPCTQLPQTLEQRLTRYRQSKPNLIALERAPN